MAHIDSNGSVSHIVAADLEAKDANGRIRTRILILMRVFSHARSDQARTAFVQQLRLKMACEPSCADTLVKHELAQIANIWISLQ